MIVRVKTNGPTVFIDSPSLVVSFANALLVGLVCGYYRNRARSSPFHKLPPTNTKWIISKCNLLPWKSINKHELCMARSIRAYTPVSKRFLQFQIHILLVKSTANFIKKLTWLTSIVWFFWWFFYFKKSKVTCQTRSIKMSAKRVKVKFKCIASILLIGHWEMYMYSNSRQSLIIFLYFTSLLIRSFVVGRRRNANRYRIRATQHSDTVSARRGS